MEVLGKSLSVALLEEDLAEVLQSSLKEQQNGNDVMLWATLMDRELSSGETFAGRLSSIDQEHNMEWYREELLALNPLLSVAISTPIGAELSTQFQRIDRVIVAPSQDPEDSDFAVGFSLNGNSFTDKIANLGSEFCYVVKTNESVGLTKGSPGINAIQSIEIETATPYSYYYTEYPELEPIPFTSYPKPALASRGCERDRYFGKRDEVERVLVKDDLECGICGKVEFCIRTYDSGSELKTEFKFKQKKFEDKWHYLDTRARTVSWKEIRSEIGSRMKYHFTEKDGNKNDEKFKVEYSNKLNNDAGKESGTFKVSAEFGHMWDDYYGEDYEFYCDWVGPTTWGNHHTPGQILEFWINVED